MIITINNKCGAKVGNIQVFTYERAVEVYKLFVKTCYKNITMESSVVLDNVTEDMHNIGFSYDELENFEISAISA